MRGVFKAVIQNPAVDFEAITVGLYSLQQIYILPQQWMWKQLLAFCFAKILSNCLGIGTLLRWTSLSCHIQQSHYLRNLKAQFYHQLDTGYQILSVGAPLRYLNILFTAIRFDFLGDDWDLAQTHVANMISGLDAVRYNKDPIMLLYKV